MASEAALVLVNQMLDQVVIYAQAVADAFSDNRLGPGEILSLILSGTPVAQIVVSTFRRATPEMRAEMAEVLKYGDVQITMPM